MPGGGARALLLHRDWRRAGPQMVRAQQVPSRWGRQRQRGPTDPGVVSAPVSRTASLQLPCWGSSTGEPARGRRGGTGRLWLSALPSRGDGLQKACLQCRSLGERVLRTFNEVLDRQALQQICLPRHSILSHLFVRLSPHEAETGVPFHSVPRFDEGANSNYIC